MRYTVYVTNEEMVEMVVDRALVNIPHGVRDCFTMHPEALTITPQNDEEGKMGFRLEWDTKEVDALNAEDAMED